MIRWELEFPWDEGGDREILEILSGPGFEIDPITVREDNMSDINTPEQPNEVSVRAKVLREAESLITGDRNYTYGSPTQNFQNTADIWNVLVQHKLVQGAKLTATDVANFMVALKLARMVAQPKRDNFVDIAGYAACGWETVEEER